MVAATSSVAAAVSSETADILVMSDTIMSLDLFNSLMALRTSIGLCKLEKKK